MAVIKFRSGRTLEIGGIGNCVIGISADLTEVGAGYDECLCEWGTDADILADMGLDPLTPDERRELCDIMIARWTAARESNPPETGKQ